MSSKKILAGAVLAALLVLVGALTLNYGPGALKSFTEKIASRALGVKVTIASIEIRPATMEATVRGVMIANPPGYHEKNALAVQKIDIVAESLVPPALIFKNVMIQGTEINLDAGATDTNLATLRKNATQTGGAGKNTAASKKDIRVTIRDLRIIDGRLNTFIMPTEQEVGALELDDFRMTGIGEKEGGVDPGTAIAAVVSKLSEQAVQAAIREGALKSLSPQSLESIKSQIGYQGGMAERAREEFNNIKSGVSGFFGSK